MGVKVGVKPASRLEVKHFVLEDRDGS